ncbi:MAG: hypothetical protein H6Q90_408 [Deltaproteobacteria bacterium]|nr:hypothetical protein [Deltaproteobacteria bacterium]
MNRTLLATAVLVWLGHHSAADPKLTRLRMKHVDGTNLHIAGNRGAIHWSADITITVDLREDNKLEASSAGTRGEHNLYAEGSGASYTTDDQTTWTTRWTGAWSQTGDKLTLDLSLVDHACKHTKTTSGYAPETLPCKAAAKRTQLACTTEQVKLDDVGAPSKPQLVSAWQCHPKTSTDLAESPAGWLLGKTTCIETTGGNMGHRSLRRCAP